LLNFGYFLFQGEQGEENRLLVSFSFPSNLKNISYAHKLRHFLHNHSVWGNQHISEPNWKGVGIFARIN